MTRILLLMVLTLTVHAQSAGTLPQFEAASVKASLREPPMGVWSASGGPGTPDPGRWTATWASTFDLIGVAYGLPPYQIAGPEWIKSRHFDVAATLPAGATREQLPLMLQRLLAERFQLAVHTERTEMPVYRLVIARNGRKLKEWNGEPPVPYLPPDPRDRKLDPDGYPILTEGAVSGRSMVRGHVTQKMVGVGIDRIALLLKPSLERPLEERTGLTGRYDILLHYVIGRQDGPALIEAIESQLGLKLEQGRGMVEILVVDRVEKVPIGN